MLVLSALVLSVLDDSCSGSSRGLLKLAEKMG